MPPFSVLDARQGYWQDRKRAWLALGIQSELGRGEGPCGTTASKRATDLAGGFGASRFQGVKGDPSPGGSPRPAMKLKDGKTQRGDGRGRPI